MDAAGVGRTAAVEFLARLRALGLRGVDDLRLTRNRRTMVSLRGRTLRVHRAYVAAPVAVHQAVADFVMVRRGTGRREAGRAIVAWAAQIPADDRRPRVQHTHPNDEVLAARLADLHRKFNAERFGGALAAVPVRVSRRMSRRLGHYTPRRAGVQPEIAISWRHVRRNGMTDAALTLLHEMVHQWQDENGLPVDHGAAFKRKAREVGISPRATRRVD
jgi:hypothetical protein